MTSLMYSISNEDFAQLVRNSVSINDVCQKLGYSNTHGNTNNLFRKRCKELDISYDHFSGKGRVKRTFENVFCENSTADQTTLRKWYKDGGYTEYKCAICGIDTWNEKPLTLRLDHINGCNNDDRLENLRWVCPNCDSQLSTYCGANEIVRYKKSGEYSAYLIPRVEHYCADCGKPLKEKSSIRCMECAYKASRKVERPSRDKLKQLIRDNPFTHIAKQFGVSDNAIRKWCKAESLPSKKSEIMKLSDEEWEII